MKRRRVVIGVAFVLALLVTGILVDTRACLDPAYFREVDEVIAHPESYLGKERVMIHGLAVRDTVSTSLQDGVAQWTFELGHRYDGNSGTIFVRHRGAVKWTVKSGADVVATGKLVREGGRLVLVTVDGPGGAVGSRPGMY